MFITLKHFALPQRGGVLVLAALRGGHPAEVVRVIDGDTFEARVRIWPGMEITTRVRLRGIDAPEMHARCEDERAKALAARDALVRILNEGTVGISRIGQDKYGGRVDADVSTARTLDVSAALFERGLALLGSSGGRRARRSQASPRIGIFTGVRNPVERGFVRPIGIFFARLLLLQLRFFLGAKSRNWLRIRNLCEQRHRYTPFTS